MVRKLVRIHVCKMKEKDSYSYNNDKYDKYDKYVYDKSCMYHVFPANVTRD